MAEGRRLLNEGRGGWKKDLNMLLVGPRVVAFTSDVAETLEVVFFDVGPALRKNGREATRC